MSLFHDSALVGASGSSGAAGYLVERSLRFNSSDSAYLSRTPASAGNRKTFTYSAWIKRSKLDSEYEMVFSARAGSSSQRDQIGFTSDGPQRFYIDLFDSSGNATVNAKTNALFRDPSAWYHFVIAFDTTQSIASNRIKAYVNGTELSFSTSSWPSQNADLNFNSTVVHTIGQGATGTAYGFNGYLADIHFIDGQALTPSSFTEVSATTGQLIPKQYTGSFGTNGFWLKFSDNSGATATTLGKDYSGNSNNWTPNNFSINQVTVNYNSAISFENCSLSGGSISNGFDSSTSTFFNTNNAANSTVVFAPSTPITINTSLVFYGTLAANQGWAVKIGNTTVASGQNDPGSPYTIPNAVGQTLSTSNPLRLISVGAGEAVYFAALSVDGSLLVNQFASDNDSLVDTPTSYGTDTGAGGEVRGNYATLNPLTLSGSGTISDGNLRFVANSAAYTDVKSTIGATTGKWYAELNVVTRCNSGDNQEFGIFDGVGNPRLYATYNNTTYTMVNGASNTSTGVTSNSGDVMQVAYDADTGKVWLGANGTWFGSGNPSTGANPYVTITANTQFFFYTRHYGTSGVSAYNFGQRSWAYAAPTGFKALCDTNLPAPVVAKPNTVFDAVRFVGNSGTNAITLPGGFSPDLVWTKSRNNALDHLLYDSVRGVGRYLRSNTTGSEGGPNTSTLASFDSSGFTLGAGDDANTSASAVAWAWDAGTTTSSNGSGSITSQVRANASAGFSIVTYTGNGTGGATVGHGGLVNLANGMIIVKRRDSAVNWFVGHGSQGWTKVFEGLNTSNTISTTSAAWNNTSPTSTVFTLGTETSMNGNGGTFVAYCFAPVAGFSSFGSVSLNASADGAFIYLGFRPKFFMIKGTDTGSNWIILDSQRDPFNFADQELFANLANAENTSGASYSFDFLSNGVKSRNTGLNGSFVYAAWAESPFAYSRAR